MALASVDGGDGYWHSRADGTDSGAMVRDELIPMALSRSGLPADARVVLLGWSMGGFGALLLASDLGPGRVAGVVGASAALWTRGSDTPGRAFDDKADVDAHSIFGRASRLSTVSVRLDCGTSDPFIRANRLLAERIARVTASWTPGGHDDDFWSAHLPTEMAWAATRFA